MTTFTASILSLLLLTLANAQCNLECPSSPVRRAVNEDCFYEIEDLTGLVHGSCTNLFQNGLGAYLPKGMHSLEVTDLDNLQTCEIDMEIVDDTPPTLVGVRGSPNLIFGEQSHNKWKDVHFFFNKNENCCKVWCNVTGVTYEDLDLECCRNGNGNGNDCDCDDRRRGNGNNDDDCDCENDDRRRSNDDDDDDEGPSSTRASCKNVEPQFEITGPRTVKLCSVTKNCKKRVYTVTGMCVDQNGLSATKTTRVITTKSQCDDPDPTCEHGIQGPQGVCCPETCGECGGVGCGTRPGGAHDCCGGMILGAGRSCSTNAPPCVVESRRR